MIRMFYGILVICCLGVLGVLYALAVQVGIVDVFQILLTKEARFALNLSLATSVSSVGIAMVLGLPVAYLMARRSFPGKFIVDSLLDIPMVMTPLVTGMGLLFLLGPNIAGQWLQKAGIDFLFTPAGAVLAQTFIATPLIIRSVRATFEGIDEKYEQAGACWACPISGSLFYCPAHGPQRHPGRGSSGLGQDLGRVRRHPDGGRGVPDENRDPAHCSLPESDQRRD